MFTHECLLRNVGEAKMHVMFELTKRGYSPMYMRFDNNIFGNNMVCEGQTWHCTDSDNKPHCIDCGENIDLFLAIAALRDDTDKYQWFFSTGWTDFEGNPLPDKWVLCDQDTLEHFAWVNNSPNSYKTGWKKATADDLIKHFNKN